MSDKVEANHTFSLLSDNFWSVHDVYTTFHSTGKVTLATTAGLNLSFDDETLRVIKSLSDSKSFSSRTGNVSLLDIDSVLAHEFLRVELVEIEVALRVVSQGRHSLHLGASQGPRPHQALCVSCKHYLYRIIL